MIRAKVEEKKIKKRLKINNNQNNDGQIGYTK